jgi:hypothetical protein
MTKTTKVLLGAVAVVLAAGSEVAAQSVTAPMAFINFNVAAQPNRRDLTSTVDFTKYDEPASLTTVERVGNGAYYELSGGYRVWHELTAGAAFSYFKSTGTGTTTAVIPSPSRFNDFKTVTVESDGLTRKEIGLHIKFSWFFPVNDKIDVAISAGPSIVQVTQDIVTASDADIPLGTQNINLHTEGQKATGVGVNFSFDGTYIIRPKLGVGLLIQYAGGKVDLDAAPDTAFGGFQAGVGIRYRF